MRSMSRPVTKEAVELDGSDEDGSVLPWKSKQNMDLKGANAAVPVIGRPNMLLG